MLMLKEWCLSCDWGAILIPYHYKQRSVREVVNKIYSFLLCWKCEVSLTLGVKNFIRASVFKIHSLY